MSAETTSAIDWDTYEPTEALRKAAMVLYAADTVEAMCFGWVPQAHGALAAALDAADLFQILAEHAEWQSYGKDGHGLRCSCGADLGEHPLSKPAYDVQHEHQAAVIRAAILGADS